MEPIQSFSFRVSSTLADFQACPLFCNTELAAAEGRLRCWATSEEQQEPTATPFNDVHTVVAGYRTAATQLASSIASCLTTVARQAAQRLQAGQAPGSDPRAAVGQANAFKLAVFFLCHLERKVAEVRCWYVPTPNQ